MGLVIRGKKPSEKKLSIRSLVGEWLSSCRRSKLRSPERVILTPLNFEFREVKIEFKVLIASRGSASGAVLGR